MFFLIQEAAANGVFPSPPGGFNANTCWTLMSEINSFIHVTRGFQPYFTYFPLKAKLKDWKKTQPTKKSRTHSRENLRDFMDQAPDDARYLPVKLLIALGLAGVERGVETLLTKFEDITFQPDVFIVEVNRRKQDVFETVSFAISDPSSKRAIAKYVSLVPPNGRDDS